jgi:hypothetical protein
MNRRPGIRLATALATTVLVASLPAAAQTVYKLIDKNGKVTYAQEPPKYFEGKVIRIDIDPNANKATLSKPGDVRSGEPEAPGTRKGAEKRSREQPSADDLLQAAREKVDEAKKALADAKDNPREGEIRFIGNVGGGTRPVPSEAYQQRLADLERAVKEAEDELRNIEKGT